MPMKVFEKKYQTRANSIIVLCACGEEMGPLCREKETCLAREIVASAFMAINYQ